MHRNQAELTAEATMSTELNFDPETGEIREPGSNATELTVSELSQVLKRTIEDRFGFVRVRGEISGYKGPHSSGHCYFALKDEGAKLDAVIWRGTFSRLRSKLQEGLEVITSGKLTSYPGKSSYQIVIENVEPAGVGALMALLEERKRKLTAEGLFDAGRKRALPFLPETIGIVTSPAGAVIRDILHRLADRFPRHVIVWPVRVQGETAAAEVAAAVAGFNALANRPDLLIVARGGGSLEDLWPFNEELVVRAVAASAIPVISAIGHETDTTLIDFAADWRAPTPTAAAEKAVPVRAELLAETASLDARLKRTLVRSLQEGRTRLRSASRALPKPDDILALARQRLDSVAWRMPLSLRALVHVQSVRLARLSGKVNLLPVIERITDKKRSLGQLSARGNRAMTVKLHRAGDRLAAETKLFASLNYKSVLGRGYVIVRDEAGKPVRLATLVKPQMALDLEFADAHIAAVARKPEKQGSLF
jgi:exodeoxyribonuclease VII large subunit